MDVVSLKFIVMELLIKVQLVGWVGLPGVPILY